MRGVWHCHYPGHTKVHRGDDDPWISPAHGYRPKRNPVPDDERLILHDRVQVHVQLQV